MSNWDWSKEDDDVVAVIESRNKVGNTVFKISDGILIRANRATRQQLSYCPARLSLDNYKKEFGDRCHIRPEKEWTIYNNDKPFGELRDEQKGKLMVASLSCAICTSVNSDLKSVEKPSWHKDIIYCAKQPEPNMTDKFVADMPAVRSNEEELAIHMINKGWVKNR